MWPLHHWIPVTHLKTSNQYALLMDMAPMYGTIHGIIIHGVYIRSLNGSVSTGVSSLDIWYYDYQETGQYICSWTSKGVNVSASTDLSLWSVCRNTTKDLLSALRTIHLHYGHNRDVLCAQRL